MARVITAACLIAGLAGALIGLLQVFAPQLCDGNVIAAPTMPGRAVGNLRQPNHLATLLIWACACATWLADRGGLNKKLAIGAIWLMVFVVVLTASRTGLWIGVPLLALWALVDRRMSPTMRRALWAAPVVAVLGWLFMHWLHLHGFAFASEARMQGNSDISSSRFAIWANTIELIRQHPWAGVGWGNFNYAWSLTPFPDRPIAFFDHTHNLFLQLAVELGLPIATLISLCLLVAMWRLLKAGMGPDAPAGDRTGPVDASVARLALFIVVMVMIHSQLEYPLWYAYFLLPTMFFWGLGLAADRPAGQGVAASEASDAVPTPSPARSGRWQRPVLLVGSVAMVVGSILAVLDYLTVVVIFEPPENAGPLEERIARGQRSVLFSYQADYAAATTELDEPSADLAPFEGALHNLIDTRLMISFARSLADRGEVDKARFVVARLREFQRLYKDKGEFLGVCDKLPPASLPPFQCDTSPTRTRGYGDFDALFRDLKAGRPLGDPATPAQTIDTAR